MHFDELIKTLKNRREALQVTQEGLAELSGVGLRTLKQIESGKGNPTLLTLQKLSDVLGLKFDAPSPFAMQYWRRIFHRIE